MGFKCLLLVCLTSVVSFAAFTLSSRDFVYMHGKPEYIAPSNLESEWNDTFNYETAKPVLVLMWDGGTPFGWGDGEVVPTPNYGGFTYIKGKCPVTCDWTTDRSKLAIADSVLFDPCLTGPTGYRDIPVYMPDKFPGQQWGWFTYEQYNYFPMMKEMDYMKHFDYKMTYHHDAQVQITFACPWAGVSDLLAPVPPKTKDKIVAAFISNCATGGANQRYEYLEELMKHMNVHSFGHCLKNADYKFTATGHAGKMHDKINAISEFKFLLAFENNIVEDYVTEKLINAYQAGTVPIYMGSPNIEKWEIGPNSLIKLSDYPKPKDLANFLTYLNDNDDEYMKYFEWKKVGLSPTFQRLWDSCFAFAECRLCKYIAKTQSRIADGDYERPEHVPETFKGHALQLNGLDSDYNGGDDYVELQKSSKLNLYKEYSLLAWIKLGFITDGRIIDKNNAGEIGGYEFDVIPVNANNANRGFIRLCAAKNCFSSQRTVGIGLWYHVAVTVTTPVGKDGHIIKFFINGKFDSEHTSTSLTETNSWPVRFGRAANGGGSWRPHHASSVFDGAIDDISIWERALTEKEIYDYMFLRPHGDVDGLVGWWPFNEGSGEIVHDVGPNEINGKIVGSPTWIVSVSKPVLDPSTADLPK